MGQVYVRKACMEDLDKILEIYAVARRFMADNGNAGQWGTTHPAKTLLETDIQKGQLFVICQDTSVCGVFAFILGEDPTYGYIDGQWHHQKPYGTIHRIAGNGTIKGILAAAVAYCTCRADYLRIDTHKNNYIMQKAVAKQGFRYCGVIYLENGDPRLAYDRYIEKGNRGETYGNE